MKAKKTAKKIALKPKRSFFKSPALYIVIAVVAVFGAFYITSSHAAGVPKDPLFGCPVNPAQRPTLVQGNTGGCVKRLQYDLSANRGFYCSAGLAVDGIFGSKTRSAVEFFQASVHIGVDGIVGPNTWSALAGYCE